jgi:hypothetical protein
MAKKHHPPPPAAVDLDRIAADLASTDEETRARAARSVCPCRMGWNAFEQCLDQVKALQKDPSPQVRGAALHVFEDAFEMENEGLPTTPQMFTNELTARKLRLRWKPLDDSDEAPLHREPDWKRQRRERRKG